MFWPPNVILLAALLVTPAQWWWPCGLTAFAAHLVVHAQLGGVPLVVMVVHFAGNMVRAVPRSRSTGSAIPLGEWTRCAACSR